MKIIVTGQREHGKNTVCDLLSPTLKAIDSSRFACEQFLFQEFADKGILYDSVEDCHKDRMNNRQLWYETIRAWNGDDPARMSREIFKHHDIYNGMRHIDELNGAIEEELVDAVFWVDASRRMPPESSKSMSITMDDANFVIDNNGSESDLPKTLYAVFGEWYRYLGRIVRDNSRGYSSNRKIYANKLREEILEVLNALRTKL